MLPAPKRACAELRGNAAFDLDRRKQAGAKKQG
jgi:hypothetical protein